MRILIVDDDPHIRDIVRITLTEEGFATSEVADGAAAVSAARDQSPDLVVLDIGLPELNGTEVCRQIRQFSDMPILFLTARDDEIDRVVGFEIGADDYVVKPFSPRELVARIKAILKRGRIAAPREPDPLSRGALRLIPARHICRYDDTEILLTATEMSLLERLMRHPDHVVTRAQLTEALYGNNVHVSDRTVDSHLRNLRKKLVEAGCSDGVHTVHGVGTRMGPCLNA